MTSPIRRKPREIPHDVIQLGLALFWGFGILGTLVYLLQVFALGASLLSGRDVPAAVAKGFSIFDLGFLLALGLNYFLSTRHRLQRTSSLVSGFLAGLVLKDLLVLANANSPIFLALAFLFSIAATLITFTFFRRFKVEVPLSKKEIPNADYGSSPLQVDAHGVFFIPSKSCEYHIQVCGGTGTGKTYRVIKPFVRQDIVNNRIGCFINDVKSNIGRDIAFYVAQAGREKEFRYFDLGFPEKSMTWNPLYSGSADEISNKAVCSLFPDPERENPYYLSLAKGFIDNMVPLLKMEHQVVMYEDLFHAALELDTFKTIHHLCQKYPKTDHAKFMTSTWLNKPVKQRQEELSGLINKLQRFCTREWSPLINTRDPQIKMNEVFEYNQIFLFGLAAQKYQDDAKPLAIMALMDIGQQVAERFKKSPPKTFRVYLDEFYQLAYPGFNKTLSLAREARVSYVLAHQSIADLSGISKEFAQQVNINTRNKVILAQDDSDGAEFFSKLLGTEEEETQTRSFDTRSMTMSPSGMTLKKEHLFRFNPNLLKELPEGYGVVKAVFPSGPFVRKVRLDVAPDVHSDFDHKPFFKTLNLHLKTVEEVETEERLDLLQERKFQEPENPVIKGLDEKYSRGRKTPKRV